MGTILISGSWTIGGKNREINEYTAEQRCSFCCVRILAETIATVPLHLYERLDEGKRRAYDHPLYQVLHDQANPEMNSFVFRETLQGHLGTWGNGYAEIEWSSGGEVKALWPLRPDNTFPERIKGKLFYRTSIGNKGFILPAYRVFHVSGFGFDELVGYKPVRMGVNSLSLVGCRRAIQGQRCSKTMQDQAYLKQGKLSGDAQDG